MTRADLPLMHEWMNREHVRRWWSDAATPEAVEARYGDAIDGAEPTRMFVIEVDGVAAGSIQTYLLSDYPKWIGDEPGVAGVDLFIADESLTGRGLGPRVLAEFAKTIVFADEAVTALVAAPEVANLASVRAFEKAGFRRERELPGERSRELLLRLER